MKEKNSGIVDKAVKIMSGYTQATGSEIRMYDQNCSPLFDMPDTGGIEDAICSCCIHCRRASGEEKREASPCHEMHREAVSEANRKGGSHLYRCRLGLLFWTSPVYTGGSFSGALRGSGFLPEKSGQDNAAVMCNGTISAEEFAGRIAALPAVDDEKTQSLAELLLLCAESLSSGSEDYHEILRRRAAQQQDIAALIEELKAKYPKEGTAAGSLPGYPLEKERMLIAALRRGDGGQAAHVLNELLAALIFANSGHFRYIQLRATELVVLLSRMEINGSRGGSFALEAHSRSLKRVQEVKTIEELTDILHSIVERIAVQINSFQGIPHASALQKAERFILENFTRKISLREIAGVAGLSAPYFSTIFKDEMGENLSRYLNRLRVEKAGRLLLETEMSLSEIAGACCFEDQSWFSKIFKSFTGFSPGKYRNQGGGMIKEISEHNLSDDYLKMR